MEYALLVDDSELFAKSWQFAREKLYRDGVFSWYVTADGVQAQANALIDDLRMYRALKNADALWGGYGTERETLARAICDYNTADGHLVGFYDFEVESAGSELPLFYIDLEALRGLAEEVEGFSDAVEEAKGILERGYIGDAFPLYYPPTTINPGSMPGRP